jgi:hypothetical protein
MRTTILEYKLGNNDDEVLGFGSDVNTSHQGQQNKANFQRQP